MEYCSALITESSNGMHIFDYKFFPLAKKGVEK
jgi:hypothetical protein